MMWSQVILNNFGSRAQNVIDTKKLPLMVVLLRIFPHIWISTPWLTNHAHACQQKDGFFYMKFFLFSTFEFICLKYLKSLQSRREFDPSISNDMWTHFLGSEVGLYVP